MNKLIKFLSAVLCVIATSTANAQPNLKLEVALPSLQVAEYHKPYVAIWLEDSKRQVTQIAVWYDVEMKNAKGEEWLADLRQWWRRAGRNLSLPIDGVTGASKGPGMHTVSTDLTDLLAKMPAGKYKIRIEAVREVGGRELVNIPLTLPLDTTKLPLSVEGRSELGLIRLSAKQ
ncbi:DUF2271 domain-containing protein [Catenovulum adriaticum]|uniref:DUF2271 domain-containing protein n=1 Tax=Catenovulum adriaticum TaxID=2984846 RepID=A0ABY7AKK7_9ALTE|nr:DUF2271 domain-containing protein [Catenovulum sp. TS8]WAJ70072.1 DUF2271 domain-containing protein [Catenovulum sp. TS8]